MTRVRCDPKTGIPTDLLAKYYEQRSGCAFILTEASSWSARGNSFPGAGNLYNKEQANGWKKVIDAVHQKGSKIFLQSFHGGRASNSKLNGGL
jgi:N-ethylmaleimide reductase